METESEMCRTHHFARPNISQTFGRSPCTFPTVAAVRMTQDRMLETRELCEQSTRSVTLLVQTTTTR